jgi:parvulin-like peptidyl-prolyl isomerase
VFKEVLNEFWGWNENDFKRELRQQLLQQAVASKLDVGTKAHADMTLAQIKAGADFGATATKESDDPSTKPAGGVYPATIAPNDKNFAPAVTNALFKLAPGQVSGIVDTGYTLEILKAIDKTGSSIHAAHIQFTIKPITTYTKPLQTKTPPKTYIKP